MQEQADGFVSNCRNCGGNMAPTGQESTGLPQSGFGGHEHRVRSAEYKCEQCGATEWSPSGTEEEH